MKMTKIHNIESQKKQQEQRRQGSALITEEPGKSSVEDAIADTSAVTVQYNEKEAEVLKELAGHQGALPPVQPFRKRKIHSTASCYSIDLPRGDVYFYEMRVRRITVENWPDLEKRVQIFHMIESRYRKFQQCFPAYNGTKYMITRRKLQINNGIILQIVISVQEKYRVIIKPFKNEGLNMCTVSLEPLHQIMKGYNVEAPPPAVTALNIILRYGPLLRCIPLTRAFYFRRVDFISEVLNKWLDYSQSPIIGKWKPFPKVNRSLLSLKDNNVCKEIKSNLEVLSICSVNDKIKEILDTKPCIIMGAYILHPPISEAYKLSIVVLVCSLDNYLLNYEIYHWCQISQEKKTEGETIYKQVEVIRNLKEMTKRLLRSYFYNNCRKKPEKIIYYRYVSKEDNMENICVTEVNAIRNACEDLESDIYRPELTFILVQKRDTTLPTTVKFPRQKVKDAGPYSAVVVEPAERNPMYYDFCLYNQFSAPGVRATPCYRVIWDDSDFEPEVLRRLTYYLSYNIKRFNRKSLMPAHLVRARRFALKFSTHLHVDKRAIDSETKARALINQLKRYIYVVY